MLWNEQQKIYNTKIIESAKLIEQAITIFLKPGTQQADADELVVTKADCGVGTRRQRLGPKLSWHTKPRPDCQVARLSAPFYCTGLPAEQPIRMIRFRSDQTDWRAPTPIQHVESAEKKSMRTNFSRWRGTHWENLVGRQTKTARRPTVGLVYTGL